VTTADLQSGLVVRLTAELRRALAADASLPAILVTVRAPRLGLDWSDAVTRADIAPQSAAMAFRIASVTKVFTAAAILRLIEQRRFGLFDRVAGLLSDETCALLGEHGLPLECVSIYNVLTHTAGLHDHAGPESPYAHMCTVDPARVWTRAEQIALGAEMGPPIALPGTHFSYSDTGYILLGEVIERATGLPLGLAVRQLLDLDSLGLTSTYWEVDEAPPPGLMRAAQYIGDTDVAAIHPSCDLFGGGGLVSTTGDLVTFMRALLRGRIFAVPGTLEAALMTPTVTFTAPARIHSALLRGSVFGGRQCWAHGGFWGVQVVDLPDSDVTLALSWGQAECGPMTLGLDGSGNIVDRLVAIILEDALP
jgi:D-alanyl-D-alanine carboxypeptidase